MTGFAILIDEPDDTSEAAPVRIVRRMTGAEVERLRRSDGPLLTTVERNALCMPSILRSSVGGHFAPEQVRLPRTDRASGSRTVATPALVEGAPPPERTQGGGKRSTTLP